MVVTGWGRSVDGRKSGGRPSAAVLFTGDMRSDGAWGVKGAGCAGGSAVDGEERWSRVVRVLRAAKWLWWWWAALSWSGAGRLGCCLAGRRAWLDELLAGWRAGWLACGHVGGGGIRRRAGRANACVGAVMGSGGVEGGWAREINRQRCCSR